MPTVLAWAGRAGRGDIPGRVASFLDVETTPPIARYETVPIPRLSRSASRSEAAPGASSGALGYIE